MANKDQKIVVIGLPFAGKTTFVAALWDVLGSGEVAGSLQLDHLDGDNHHLNEIRNRWADCQEIERTKISNETMVAMWLKDTRSEQVSQLVFTDMSGESFEQQWTERVCTREYSQLIDQITGALLFIHPRHVKEAVLIRDTAAMIRHLPSPSPTEVTGNDIDAPKFTTRHSARSTVEATMVPALPTKPSYASTQVQLAELLQFIRNLRSSQTDKLRLGVVISAWDLIEKQSKSEKARPGSWLRQRAPLLDQFIRANPESFDYDVFGVSAQGGELEQAEELRRLSYEPSKRIVVVHGAHRSHDITVPVRWVLGFDSGAPATSAL